MAYVGPRGLPLSTFLDWPQDDQDHALEWQRRERERDRHCHTPAVDWDESRGGDRDAYHVEQVHCRGCEILADYEKRNPELGPGVSIQLVPSSHLPMWGGRGV